MKPLNSYYKYRNKPTEVNWQRFDSKKEAERYKELQLLQAGKEIRNLRTQVPYDLAVNGRHICRYVADFVYEEKQGKEWREVVEDTKGCRTPLYIIKRKLMIACHDIEIRET